MALYSAVLKHCRVSEPWYIVWVGVLRAQHSPLQGRLLFIPVMSILLGISASIHTTCCAQQCGEARASRVVVSACQSQSQGSVSSHQSEKSYPDVACLPSPHGLPLKAVLFPLLVVLVISTSTRRKLMLLETFDYFIHCLKLIERNIFLQLKKGEENTLFSTSREAVCFCVCVGVHKGEGWCWGREQSEVIRREHHNIL